MAIDLTSIITGALKPISDIIDNLHTSKEEKAAAKLAMVNAQGALQNQLMGYQKDIIIAEATGESWLQRNWRPIIMLLFGSLLAWNYVVAPLGSWIAAMFGGPAFPALEMPTEFFTLLTVGIGGYIGGRSAEKAIKSWRGDSRNNTQ